MGVIKLSMIKKKFLQTSSSTLLISILIFGMVGIPSYLNQLQYRVFGQEDDGSQAPLEEQAPVEENQASSRSCYPLSEACSASDILLNDDGAFSVILLPEPIGTSYLNQPQSEGGVTPDQGDVGVTPDQSEGGVTPESERRRSYTRSERRRSYTRSERRRSYTRSERRRRSVTRI